MCLSVFKLLDQIDMFEEFQMKNAILEKSKVFSAIEPNTLQTAAISASSIIAIK